MLNGEPKPSANYVLDASALLALINREPGAERVEVVVQDGAVMSSVNLVEVVSKLIDADFDEAAIRLLLGSINVDVVDFTADQAIEAGLLRLSTRGAGLSLADRACLALARVLSLPALTADRAWGALGLAVDVELIR